MGIRQVKLEKVSRRVAGVALAALGGLLLTQAVAVAQQKEIAVMLPAAGDPYFKLKAAGYIVCDDYHHAGFWEDGVTRAVDEFVASGRAQRIFKRRSQFVMRKPGRA